MTSVATVLGADKGGTGATAPSTLKLGDIFSFANGALNSKGGAFIASIELASFPITKLPENPSFAAFSNT